jgi:hypothetical protein
LDIGASEEPLASRSEHVGQQALFGEFGISSRIAGGHVTNQTFHFYGLYASNMALALYTLLAHYFNCSYHQHHHYY